MRTGRVRRRSLSTRTAGFVAAVLTLGALSTSAAAQSLPLKRTFASATAGICPRFTPPAPATGAKVQEARRLFALGQEAAIVGDHRAARDLFRQAQELNGADERISYYLARSNEELNATNDAVAQYCRYLTLAPSGSDAGDVRSRLDRLTAATSMRAGIPAGRRAAAATRFQSAVEAVDRGQLPEAERRFGEVIGELPSAAEAYYDRGLVRARAHDWGGAERDLQKYLSLRSDADDAAAVRERVALLRRAASNPSTALAGGIVLPGFAQFYTRRPVFGTIVAAAAAGGVALALRQSDRTKDTTYTDAFGNPYPGKITRTDRYDLGTGLAIAGGVAVAGALEGYLYAKGRRAEAGRLLAGRDPETTDDRRFGAWLAPVRIGSGDERIPSRLGLALGGRLRF